MAKQEEEENEKRRLLEQERRKQREMQEKKEAREREEKRLKELQEKEEQKQKLLDGPEQVKKNTPFTVSDINYNKVIFRNKPKRVNIIFLNIQCQYLKLSGLISDWLVPEKYQSLNMVI